jgi:cytochrome c biogenesis protein CcmG, thiol:disulfide interchange protein DsbE
MNRIQRALGKEGLVVIAVNVDRRHLDPVRFIQEHEPQFRIVFDPDGGLPMKFGVRGVPTTFLIDRNGHIQSRHQRLPPAARDALTQQVRSLVLARS